MAEKREFDITIEWKNNEYFEVKSKQDDAAKLTIIRVDENNHIDEAWADIDNIVLRFVTKVLKTAKDEMAM